MKTGLGVIFHQAATLHARLNAREQRLVAVFGGLLAVTLVWTLVLAPLAGLRESLRGDVAKLSGELGELRELGAQVRALEASGAKADRRKPDPDFSLLAFMDRVTSGAVAAESVEAMSPSRRRVDADTEENTVELRLAAVSLTEAVELLRALERSPNPVFIKQFDLRKRYDDDSRFDVTMVTAALVRS
jgi:type II secretory pathway component PulM